MPGMNGLEVCRALKANPDTATLPIMMVTASLEESVRDRATELGAAAFVTKPFRIFELSQRMHAALRVSSREGDPPTAPHIRLRRQRADALSALPPPATLRLRLQREIDACARDDKPVVCAVLRLENEGQLTSMFGRSTTDALLGSAVIELARDLDDRIVRGDVDEIVVFLAEEQLPRLATIAAQVAGEGRVGAGVSLGVDVCLRWGATIADPNESDPDRIIAAARAALEKAQLAGEPGGIERTLSTSID
jgi:PleD family two-component response regulator